MHRPVSGLVGVRRALSILGVTLVVGAASSAAPATQLPVTHTVVRTEERTGRLDLAKLKPVTRVTVTQAWVDRERSRTRTVIVRDGIAVEDSLCAAPACSSGSPTQTGRTYRARVLADLRAGRAQTIRTGVLRGRQVRWIRYGRPGNGQVIVLDPSYRVVREEEWSKGRRVVLMETIVDERLPARDAYFITHPAWPELAGQSRPEGRLVESADAARAVRGAHWAGESVGGLKLNAIRERPWTATTKTGKPLSGTILHLRYGDWLGSFFHPRKRLPGAGVEITQVAADSPARWWMMSPPGLRGEYIPPPGTFVDIHSALAYVKLGGGDTYYPVAVLQKGGVWMVVKATSWPLLEKTLRSLKPIA